MHLENAGATPAGGFGYIRRMRERTSTAITRKFEAWIVLSIHFQEVTQATQTREGQINWGVPTLTGNADGLYVDASGEPHYRAYETFETAAAAKAWLNTMLNVSATTT
jgi:hypothetical protein